VPSYTPPHATANTLTTATPHTPPTAPDDSTASAVKPDAGEKAVQNDRGRTGAATANAQRIKTARVERMESTDARSVETARVERSERVNVRRIESADTGRVESADARRVGSADARRVESAGGRVPVRSSTTPNFDRPRVDVPVAESAEGNDVVAGDGDADVARDADDRAARRERAGAEDVERAGATSESKTARHVEQAQLLLRSFRNARPADAGRSASSDLAYEKQRSKKLLYENIVLRREAASRGNLPVESLLDSLEPILIDIANLPDRPAPAALREINERMRRKNLVAMLQISAVESASARSY
jgi:hypothetical protein